MTKTCDCGTHLDIFCTTVWVDIGDPGLGGVSGGWTGGGSTGGGGNWEDEDPCRAVDENFEPCNGGDENEGWVPIEDETSPCDAVDKYSGSTATLQYTGLKPTVQEFTAFDPNVTDQPEEYFLVNDVNGSYVPGPIQPLPTTGGSMQGVTSSTVMAVHTHPYGGYPSPSPEDFFSLDDFGSNFQIHYVVAFNGTKYAMVINNYSQLHAFVTANPGAIASDGSFNPGTTAGDEWWEIVYLLGQQGYSDLDAYERALAFIMKQAGVTLVKAAAGSDTFKKIGLRQKLNPDGTPAVNAQGEPIYENADC